MSRSCPSSPGSMSIRPSISSMLESLNDIVARITKIRVRETVPDSMIDLACDIELIDLIARGSDCSPQRRQGLSSRPSRACHPELFFAGNLTALRELALRGRRKGSTLKWSIICVLIALKGRGQRASAFLFWWIPRGEPMPSCAMPNVWRIACAPPVDRDPCRNAGDARATEAERDKIAQTLRLAQRLGAAQFPYRRGCRLTVAEYARGQSFCAHIITAKIRATALAGLFQ